ncbi:hypothetical protein T11_10067 [Trichinella zimbabwensis]|uniref:Uncharacterized protein n=1 Tax=Trichinella zimbabwensis TaxID=268475 RepID=A0A0V1I356_9BILA|nr:hypothetical protein T11_10067 [Trichinella zimbabwensis]
MVLKIPRRAVETWDMIRSEICLPGGVVTQWSRYHFPSPDGSTNPQLSCQPDQLDANFNGAPWRAVTLANTGVVSRTRVPPEE